MQPVKPILRVSIAIIIAANVLLFAFASTYSGNKLTRQMLEMLFYPLTSTMHSRETLQRDYEEVFATPFSNVQVTKYTNSKSGHGTRFSMSLQSTCPLELKNPESYKAVSLESPDAHYGSYRSDWFAKDYPWITTCLYRQIPASGYTPPAGSHYDPALEPIRIWIYLNQTKDLCHVYSSK